MTPQYAEMPGLEAPTSAVHVTLCNTCMHSRTTTPFLILLLQEHVVIDLLVVAGARPREHLLSVFELTSNPGFELE